MDPLPLTRVQEAKDSRPHGERKGDNPVARQAIIVAGGSAFTYSSRPMSAKRNSAA